VTRILLIILFFDLLLSQSIQNSNLFSLPLNFIINEFENKNNSKNKKNNQNFNSSSINFSFHSNLAINSGHPNIDNNAEFYSPGLSSNEISARLSYNNKWLSLELEPYYVQHMNIFPLEYFDDNFRYSNNYYNGDALKEMSLRGFKQSQIKLHYRGLEFRYGQMSHWWSPGFHSAIALSSNAPSQETYSFGTFHDLSNGKISFGSEVIIMPYKSIIGDLLYFSGLRGQLTFHSNPIVNVGFHRTFQSGDISNLQDDTNFDRSWTFQDALMLVFEPLFGQNKRELDYVIPGTPGFDSWDEVLTGYVKLTFPDENLEVYADIASDDSRANIADLRAHWDHSIGYLIGYKKYFSINDLVFLTGTEYLSTRISNTYKSEFFRGMPNQNSFYAKREFDYFTYKGRRMGAHSGSSSDDLIFLFGVNKNNSILLFSINFERHGIKSMQYPEKKNEFSVILKHDISSNHRVILKLEYEKIDNFSFINQKESLGKLLWLNYSYFFR